MTDGMMNISKPLFVSSSNPLFLFLRYSKKLDILKDKKYLFTNNKNAEKRVSFSLTVRNFDVFID